MTPTRTGSRESIVEEVVKTSFMPKSTKKTTKTLSSLKQVMTSVCKSSKSMRLKRKKSEKFRVALRNNQTDSKKIKSHT